MIALLAAAAVAAPCNVPNGGEPIARNRHVVVYRGRGVRACTRRVRVRLQGLDNVIGVRLAGRRVVVATGYGGRRAFSRIYLRVYRMPDPGLEATAALAFPHPTHERIVRMRLHRSGALAFAVTGGRERGVYVLNRHGRFALDRRADVDLRSLAMKDGRIHWRRGGAPQQAPVDVAPPGPPGDCSIPPGARRLAEGAAVVFSLEVADVRADDRSTVYGCLPGSSPLLLEKGFDDGWDARAIEVAAVRAPLVALDLHMNGLKHGSRTLQVRDLRDGTAGAKGCVRAWAYAYPDHSDLVRAFVSASGRIGCSLRHQSEGTITGSSVESVAPGDQEPTQLDSGPDVDPESLHVEGEELVWTRGGARRSAAFP